VVNLNHFVGRSLNTGNLFDSLFNRLRVTTRGNEWQLIFARAETQRSGVLCNRWHRKGLQDVYHS
jgi:hypothetical protein